MTKLLEQAFAEVSKLPEKDQDAMAAIIMEELASERRWDELFAKSPEKLEKMAMAALRDFREGRTEPLDPDRL